MRRNKWKKKERENRVGKTISMAEMQIGERGKVVKLEAEPEIKERFLALGLKEGTEITCLFSAFFKEPVAFDICGCMIALRKKDRQGVLVTIIKNKEELYNVKQESKETVCTIALAGNPNVGKSTLFNAITGLHQHTGNWTGKTVELAMGSRREGNIQYKLCDLPGTYSLNSHSEEEEAAEQYLREKNYDVVVVVCDATCLQRNLLLVLEILEITKNVILCVNLLDEAEKKEIAIDLTRLSEHLAIPVVGCTARSGKGIKQLLAECLKMKKTREVQSQRAIPQVMRAKEIVKEGVPEIKNWKKTQENWNEEQIIADVVTVKNHVYRNKEQKLDTFLTSKYTGIPIMLFLLFVIFWITIKGANVPSVLLAEGFTLLEKRLRFLFLEFRVPSFLMGLFFDGIYQVTTFVISVMLPPMAIFFPLFTILEDYGYLPRVAFNLDCTFQKCKACGKQALTMAMGFGCSAVGVTGCRIIDSKRERIVAMLTNCFVPCNGKFPTLAAMIGVLLLMLGKESSFLGAVIMTACILLSVFMTFFVSKILSDTLLKGEVSAFTLELPPYRRPQFGKVLVHSFLDRTLFVLGRAIMVAAPVGVLIWLLGKITWNDVPIILKMAELLDPVGRFFGMDGIILTAFLLGFPANEIVVPMMLMLYFSAEHFVEFQKVTQLNEVLAEVGWTPVTILCVCIFMLFHWPCSTTLLTLYKETKSIKWTAVGFFIPTILGLFFCAIIHFLAVLFFL